MTLDLITSSFSSTINYNKSLVYNRNSLHCSVFPRFTLYFSIQTIFLISSSFQTVFSFSCIALRQYLCKFFFYSKIIYENVNRCKAVWRYISSSPYPFYKLLFQCKQLPPFWKVLSQFTFPSHISIIFGILKYVFFFSLCVNSLSNTVVPLPIFNSEDTLQIWKPLLPDICDFRGYCFPCIFLYNIIFIISNFKGN